MTTPNQRNEVEWRRRILGALTDFHSHEDAWHISLARQHQAEDSVGTPNEMRDCDAYSATVNNGSRAIGCWEDAVKPIVKEAWLAGTFNDSPDTVYRTPQEEIATRFGTEISIKREQEIAALLRRTILLTREQRKTEVDAFADTLNDIKITWRSGNGYVQIFYPDGTSEPNRRYFAGNYIIFDAPARAVITRITPADSTGTLFDLEVAPRHKGIIAAYNGEERENLTNNATDDHVQTIESYEELNRKITGTANIEVDVRTA